MVKVGDRVRVTCCNWRACDLSGEATVVSVGSGGVIDVTFSDEGEEHASGPYGVGEYVTLDR